ncbi:PRC and DUF2382 domain-containing protein [Modestobacter sp. Leaf380]|uniref:PRC and DUF2382 domain-containing protein n=1 Tax=Modestobacter sp. Leaf380 TaxID=1736356 RepID=UPI0006F2536E|nr:PRC and DUF2382 domain-containing protein [Modestobacter sp. Leaf380]KQS63976.1 hypothetical protein ASG41_17785 [Modestobacter sp. Leaf380]
MSIDPASLVGTTATDRDGGVLGTVRAVWLDDATGQPTWVGLADGAHAAAGDDEPVTVVPLADHRSTADGLQLGVDPALTRGAPRLRASQRLSPEDELRFRQHYARGSDAPGPAAPDALRGPGTVRSEERLSVRSSTVPWSRAVLRVETVTEQVMVPVTVTRQRARVEHLPLTPVSAAGGTIPPGTEGQATDWVTLWGEQPVVGVERVPLERVRLRTDWVTREDTVRGQLAHEEIAVDVTDGPR